MSSIPKDSKREKRIDYEIVVDAYSEEERAMGWYYYLEDNLNFPFSAKWLDSRNPEEGKNVNVIDLSSTDECLQDIFIEVEYDNEQYSVRLEDIKAVDVDEATQTAIEDWKYWVERGYEF